jgi:hypothetical protein
MVKDFIAITHQPTIQSRSQPLRAYPGRWAIAPISEGHSPPRKLRLVVSRNERPKIESITIVGNQQLSDEELRIFLDLAAEVRFLKASWTRA